MPQRAPGIVVEAFGGWYYVALAAGAAPAARLACRARGVLKHRGKHLAVGDRVVATVLPDGSGVIEDVLPRSTVFARPRVANVDQVVTVMSLASPEPDYLLLDRLLVVIARAGLTPTVCFNKSDLVTAYRARKEAGVYARAGYRVVVTSAVAGRGIARLRKLLVGHITVLSGPSGVGKSALLNALGGADVQTTGELSRIERGRHTTRRTSLLGVSGGGLVADTPGFSKLDLSGIEPRELGSYFPEIQSVADRCRFAGCLHDREPDCAVKDLLKVKGSGTGGERRYVNYISLLKDVRDATGKAR